LAVLFVLVRCGEAIPSPRWLGRKVRCNAYWVASECPNRVQKSLTVERGCRVARMQARSVSRRRTATSAAVWVRAKQVRTPYLRIWVRFCMLVRVQARTWGMRGRPPPQFHLNVLRQLWELPCACAGVWSHHTHFGLRILDRNQ
jgi:hypothetical protein